MNQNYFSKKAIWTSCLATFLMFFSIALTAQITGVIQDASGETLVGANVIQQGTTNGVTTDLEGIFTIDVPEGTILEISYTGFQTQQATASKSMKIVLAEGIGLEEVMVTAQKRGENVQKTPISIAVLDGSKIAERGVNTMDNAIRQVPGLEFQQTAEGGQVYLRGVGSGIDPNLADPSVAIMVDGVYNGRSETLQAGIFDMDRIEVLRGPQGTLYGRNATGGSINIITANPKLSGNEGNVRLMAGDFGMLKGEAMYNAALSDKFAVRVAGFYERRNGYIDDGSDNLNHGAGRLKFLYQPSDKLKVVGKVELYRRDDLGFNTVPVPGSGGGELFFPPPFFVSNFDPSIQNGPPFTGGVPELRFPNGWQQVDPNNPWSNNPEHVPGFLKREADLISLQIDADLGKAGTLTILPGYSRTYHEQASSFLFGSVAPFVGPTFSNENFVPAKTNVAYGTVEARLASKESSKLKYLIGAFYLNSQPVEGFDRAVNIINSLNQEQVESFTLFQPATTVAAFGQFTYPVSNKFRGTLGLRLSNDVNGQGYEINIEGAPFGEGSFEQNITNFQYKVGIEADLRKNSLLYAHVSTGFKQGGLNATIPAKPFDEETLTAYEIGVKNRFADGRVQLNVSAFYYDFDGLQIWNFENLAVGDAVDSDGNEVRNDFQVVNNAGNSTILGAEIDLVAAAWKGGIVNVSANFLDAEYGDFIMPNNPFVGQGDFQLEGLQVQNSPNYSFNVGLFQEVNLGKGTLNLGLQSKISDSYVATHEPFVPGTLQEAYTRTNFTANYSVSRYNFGLFVNNIENDAQTTFAFPAYRRMLAPPRHLGVTAGVKF